mmetsp:Transcript_15118/g.49297  ORF Transcript_15118/g.49297 Transcript_15118/m.49297 type:complete len:244 (+) Transcript_15118:792-1523(+)
MNERRVCEVCDERVLALDARVVDLGDLVRVEAAPLAAVEFLVESGQVVVRGEIDEGVPDIALVLEVDGEVQQVELARVIGLHEAEQSLLGKHVGDVPNHHRRTTVLVLNHLANVDCGIAQVPAVFPAALAAPVAAAQLRTTPLGRRRGGGLAGQRPGLNGAFQGAFGEEPLSIGVAQLSVAHRAQRSPELGHMPQALKRSCAGLLRVHSRAECPVRAAERVWVAAGGSHGVGLVERPCCTGLL